jgi:hypothetical protein
VKQSLEAFGEGRSHRFQLSRRIPVRCGGDRSAVCSEAEEHRVVTDAFPRQLTDIPLPELAHFSCTGIAYV